MINCFESNGSKIQVKSLFDPTPQPQRNKLLIYDDDPHKHATMTLATERHADLLRAKVEAKKAEDSKITEYQDLLKRREERREWER